MPFVVRHKKWLETEVDRVGAILLMPRYWYREWTPELLIKELSDVQGLHYSLPEIEELNDELHKRRIVRDLSEPDFPAIFSDNFPEADGPAQNWTVLSGIWAVVDHIYQQTRQDYWNTAIVSDPDAFYWDDYSIKAKVRRDVTKHGAPGIYVHYINDPNHYRFAFETSTGKLGLYKGSTLLASVDFPNIVGTWYELKLLFDGNTIKGYVDDILKIDYFDPAPITKGKIGLCANYTACSFDNINVES